jgi:hypothetical protein
MVFDHPLGELLTPPTASTAPVENGGGERVAFDS